MPSEKNDSLAVRKIKTVAIKRRAVEPKAEAEKEAGPAPKKSKLSVRITSRSLKIKDEPVVEKEKIEGKNDSEEKKSKKEKSAKEVFHRESHYIQDEKGEAAHQAKHKGKEEKSAEKKKAKAESRSVGAYRKIIIFFVGLTVLLLAAAFYFFFITLTVEVTPRTERISDKLSVVVYNGEKPSEVNLAGLEAVSGSIEQIPVKEEKEYSATGAEILGQEIIGKVTIINNYTQDKTLVATTRLLSPEGKLFRIKDQVQIPAGGSKEVVIYTDEPSQDMAIGPTEFTIPGLWAGLQDKIYAKSSAAFVYQTQVKKFVQAIDIEKASQDLKETLVKKVNDQFGGNYKGFDKVIAEIDKDSLRSSSTAEAKDQVEKFKISISSKVNVIAFKSSDLAKLAKEKLLSVVSAGQKVVELEKDKMEFNLVSADFAAGTAMLEVPIVGTTRLSTTDNIVDKEKLVGLTADQIKTYLASLNKFSDVKLTFWPNFINKAPSLVDRIKIVIK